MKSKKFAIGCIVLISLILGFIAFSVYYIDPFFHYHKPHTDRYFYPLDNNRSMNDGIIKHFEYDAIIIGTSMTDLFKTSECDELFDVSSIKTPFPGGSYRELNDNLITALKCNPDLKLIIRCLDSNYFLTTKDYMRDDLGTYPTYLYDSNPFNDVEYLFNKDIIFDRIYPMQKSSMSSDVVPGIESFDSYSAWQKLVTWGINTVCQELTTTELKITEADEIGLSEKDRKNISENITMNVTSLADKYPDVEFYYFFPPYSIFRYLDFENYGVLKRQLDAEQYIIELILEHDNIHLFSFNTRFDITTDLNNYKDNAHYAEWINSLMLKWMHDGKYQLTRDNYLDYLEEEREFYTNFDYESLNGQIDYESDYYAAALLNEELSGAVPIDLLSSEGVEIDRSNGMQFHLDELGEHRYLTFYGQGTSSSSEPSVFVYDTDGEPLAQLTVDSELLDGEKHQFVLNLPKIHGAVTIDISGGDIDGTEDAEYPYVFSEIVLY